MHARKHIPATLTCKQTHQLNAVVAQQVAGRGSLGEAGGVESLREVREVGSAHTHESRRVLRSPATLLMGDPSPTW